MYDRLKTHFDLNTHLSMMSDKRLRSFLSKAKITTGLRQNGVVELDGHKLFVKRIPLTDLEVANAYSTKNHYGIPTWYNYGIGSFGFGAFRELAAHIKTTNWVRDGQCETFPLLHHHRIVTTEECKPNFRNFDQYIEYWNGSKTIKRYLMDRGKSTQQLLLFLEYLTPVSDWMVDNPTKLGGMFRKALTSIDFLKQNDMVHFDGHVYNWLTNGRTMLLTDFGLLLDREFELTKSELQFLNTHRNYDYAQVVETFGYASLENYFSHNDSHKALVEKELARSAKEDEPYINSLVRAALYLHERKQFKLPTALTEYIRRYQPIINAKNDFFQDLRTGRKASDKYPARRLSKLLRKLEIID